MLKVTVDGIQVEVEHDATILDAAKKAGVRIPTFCHDDRIAPTGACRICLVEMEGGPPRLYASCVTPATDEMVITTNSPKIARARKTNMELLLIHHPLDCPTCPASGSCGLQDLTFEFGLQSGRFKIAKKEKPTDRSNPCIEQNDNRCVLCSKCIRVCDEVQGVNAIGLVKRGFEAYVDTPFGKELDCDFCGHCVTTCPVGARNSRFLMQGRAWDVRESTSLCSFCGTGCTLSYDVRDKDNKVVRARALGELGINGNFQCSKGWQGFQYVHSGDRLEEPMVRSGENLSTASWDDALGQISRNLKDIIAKHGPQAVAGMGSERLTNEENYLFQKFFRTVIGSNNVDNLQNLKNRAVGEALPETLGNALNIAPLDILEKIPLIFLVGADATEDSPVVGNMIRRAATKFGSKFIVANSRNIRLSQITSASFKVRVGTEAALINGLIYEILSKNLIAGDAAASRVKNLEELKKAVSEYTPENVEKITAIPSTEIGPVAEMLASSEGTAFICGKDIIGHSSGNPALEALKNLVLLTGNADGKKGGIMFLREYCNSQGVNDVGVAPNYLPGYQSLQDPEIRTKFAKVWGKTLPAADGGADIIQQALDGKIKALYIMGEDPILRYPDGEKIQKALANIDFIICQDIFLTGTAPYANVILPGVSFAEKTGTFTNMEGRVQNLDQQIQPLGDALPDLQIIRKVAESMGAQLGPDTAEGVMKEIAELSPLYRRVSQTKEGLGCLVSYTHSDAKTSGKAGISSFIPPDRSSGNFPFTLITGNLLHHLGPYSGKSQALSSISSACFAEINPQDQKDLGIADGDTVQVQSARGKLSVKAVASPKSPQGLIFIPNNFEDVPVNTLFSGESDVASVKITKSEG